MRSTRRLRFGARGGTSRAPDLHADCTNRERSNRLARTSMGGNCCARDRLRGLPRADRKATSRSKARARELRARIQVLRARLRLFPEDSRDAEQGGGSRASRATPARRLLRDARTPISTTAFDLVERHPKPPTRDRVRAQPGRHVFDSGIAACASGTFAGHVAAFVLGEGSPCAMPPGICIPRAAKPLAPVAPANVIESELVRLRLMRPRPRPRDASAHRRAGGH